jgi:methylmalonyl-CoA mutase N-terminal domain/subunit
MADFAYGIAQRKQSGEHAVVGVNRFVDEAEAQPIEIHRNDPESERRQIDGLLRVKRERDGELVRRLLAELQEVVRDRSANVMPLTIEAVKARASMGEIVDAVREVTGAYTETPVF